MRPEDVPAELVDAAYPAALAHGIPWHDDAVRILLAAALPDHEAMVRAKVAEEIEAEELAMTNAEMADLAEVGWDGEHLACGGVHRRYAARIARGEGQ